jgi:hypothetical protein
MSYNEKDFFWEGENFTVQVGSQADIQFPKECLVTRSEIMAGSISSNIVASLLRKWLQALTAP